MDLNKLPKQFCDSISIAYSPEYFAFAMFSGQNGNAYAITPEHAKRLLQYLSYNLENYEKTFGTINAEWSPGIQSPIQMIDLNNPNQSQG